MHTPVRGRPRPVETIERDRQIHRLISERPLSRNDLCKRTGLSTSLVWLSLNRLRDAGKARKVQGVGEQLWVGISARDGT